MNRDTELLQEGRRRERSRALFYRFLSGDAESAGDEAAAERLNALLADEQHHVSRLTARILEVGELPGRDFDAPEVPALEEWEEVARGLEADEVAWYEAALPHIQDATTRAVLEEILASERHHHEQLAGKWMSASATDPEERG